MERNQILYLFQTIVRKKFLNFGHFKKNWHFEKNFAWMQVQIGYEKPFEYVITAYVSMFHSGKWLLVLMLNFLIKFYNNILNVLWEHKMNLMSMEYPKALLR